jgi:C1A family cysteine protease
MDIHWSAGGGWQPDLPDHRDFTVRHAAVWKRLRRLKPDSDQTALPAAVDWREYCDAIAEDGALPTSSANACAALVQYFERRAAGRIVRPSRLFLHANATRLVGHCSGVSLRAALKALVRFGAPPEQYWPYRAAALLRAPPAFTYGFTRRFRKIRFFRLDPRQQSGEDTLKLAQAFLAAGFLFVVGFPVSSAVGQGAEIPFPTVFDSIRAGIAALVVGYDDGLRIHSEKGAFLVRTPWGGDWGDQGYGWLPYAFVRERIAVDLWTLLKRSWLRSGEFHLPAASAAAGKTAVDGSSSTGPSNVALL